MIQAQVRPGSLVRAKQAADLARLHYEALQIDKSFEPGALASFPGHVYHDGYWLSRDDLLSAGPGAGQVQGTMDL